MNKKKFDTGLIGRIADKGKKLNEEKKFDNTNVNSETSTSTKIKTNTSTDTNTSTNISTSKKKKYPKKSESEKIQRAYYFEKELLKEFELFCKKNNADKSEVISFALREFLNTYE